MKLRDILEDLQVLSASADMEREITGICYDSRLVKPGDLFVAVRGLTVDGHRFIPKPWSRARLQCCARICRRGMVPGCRWRTAAMVWRSAAAISLGIRRRK